MYVKYTDSLSKQKKYEYNIMCNEYSKRRKHQDWITNEGQIIYYKHAAVCRLCLHIKAAISNIVVPSMMIKNKLKRCIAVDHMKRRHKILYQHVFSY